MAVLIATLLLPVVHELLKVVVDESIKTTRFNTLLKHLQNTLQLIQPVVYENRSLINVLDRPEKETLLFISYLKREKNLVLKCSRITFWNRYQKVVQSYKLIQLNKELVRFFKIESKIPIEIDDLEEKVDQLVSSFTSHVSVGFNWHLKELKLDISSENWSIPESINNMGQLQVLVIRGQCDHPSKLQNISSIASLSSLTTLRFEHVSIPSLQPIFALRNLKQISFVMCEVGDALMSMTTKSHYNMLPNLTDLQINMCYDLKELPSGLFNLVHLQKLSITNCHELDVLPEGFGSLSNLESLSLHCCTKVQELPEAIGSLCNLSSVDISDCLSITSLPEEIRELHKLRVLTMNGCTGLQELPMSTCELSKLEEVICDEETSYLWMDFESDLPNLKITVVEDDRLETFMKIVH